MRTYSVTIKVRNKISNWVDIITTVYGPNERSQRKEMWKEFMEIRGDWKEHGL